MYFAAIKSKELASTKKQAAQKVALSLVRQLFHLGAIEGAEPGQLGAKKLKSDEVCINCQKTQQGNQKQNEQGGHILTKNSNFFVVLVFNLANKAGKFQHRWRQLLAILYTTI